VAKQAELQLRRNVEAKFRLPDVESVRRRAEAIGFEYAATLVQHDTFFASSNGKLKLRQQTDGHWLIYYERHREQGLELSNYQIVAVSEPLELQRLLSAALGVVAKVEKRRILLRRANVRLHLDEVVNRGTFGELEAVIDIGGEPASVRAEIADILKTLQIPPEELIEVSYFELPP
jgi:predicted adenylyl cyclase CyaB